MRVLVAGWQGQVAQALVEAATTDPRITAFAIGRPALDLCTPSAIAGALSDRAPDVIINTAGFTAVDDAEDRPDRAHRLNCVGAGLLAAEATRRGAAIIQLSTVNVFDGTASEPYRSDATPCPVSVYGRTKHAGEAAVRAAADRHVILRTSWIVSAQPGTFVHGMWTRAGNEAEIAVVDNEFGNPTSARDLADALLAIARAVHGEPANSGVWGTYHAASQGCTSWAGIAAEVMRVAVERGRPPTRIVPVRAPAQHRRATRLANATLDCSCLEHRFGITLPPWQEGVASCLAQLSVRHAGSASN